MPWIDVIWTEENVQHIRGHGVTPAEVEQVLADPIGRDLSESTGRPIVLGYTNAGRRLAVVYEEIDSMTVYPVTAYEIEE